MQNLDRAHCALLVIDVLEDGLLPAEKDRAAAYVAAVNRALDAFHAAGAPVIFACDAHLPEGDRELELWGAHALAGTAACQPATAARREDGDLYLPKRRYSAFFGTSLDLYLRERAITTLVLVGADTNICVRHTAADAFFLGYHTVVVPEATFTCLIGEQEEGLDYLVRCYGTRLMTPAELAAALA
jgi:nicotinamidase-related amidase